MAQHNMDYRYFLAFHKHITNRKENVPQQVLLPGVLWLNSKASLFTFHIFGCCFFNDKKPC